MKIFITHEFPFQKKFYGGGNQIVEGMSLALYEQGHDVTVLTTGKGELIQDKVRDCVRFVFLIPYFKNLSGLSLGFCSIYKIIKQKPNLIICFTSESAILGPFSKLLGVKLYMYQAAPEYPIFSKLNLTERKNKLGLLLQYIGVKYCSKVLSISNYTTSLLVENWKIDPDKILTMGVGLNSIFLEPILKIIPPRVDRLRIISIGRIVFDQKPFNIIPEILCELEELIESWVVIGDGPDLNKLRKMVAGLSIQKKVVFKGALESELIKKELIDADIALLPSNYESFFLTAYESAAMGLVVLTNDVADIKPYFGGVKSVLIAPKGEINVVKSQLKYCIQNWVQLKTVALITSNKVKNDFNWANIVNNLFKN